jgi:hypothetical protein
MNLHHIRCAVADGLAAGPRGTTARLIAICAIATATALAPTVAGARPTGAPEGASVTAGQLPRTTQNLVSPDARDAARTSSLAGTTDQIDLRSPDARDAADGRGTWSAPRVTVVKAPQSTGTSSGFDWGDAGIGAGAVAALILLGLGGGLVSTHRRRGGRRPQRSATIA